MVLLTSRPWYVSDVAEMGNAAFGILALSAPGAPQAKTARARSASRRLLVKFRRRRPTRARAIGAKPYRVRSVVVLWVSTNGSARYRAPASSARSRCTRRQVAAAHETSRIGRKHHGDDVASPRLLDVQVSRAPHCSRTDRHGISRCHEQQQCCSRQLQGLTVLTMLTVKVYHSDAASAADGVQC